MAEHTTYLTRGNSVAEAREALQQFLAWHSEQFPNAQTTSLGLVLPTQAGYARLPDDLRELEGFPDAFRRELDSRDFDPDHFSPFFAGWRRMVNQNRWPDYDDLVSELSSNIRGPLSVLMSTTAGSSWFATMTDHPAGSNPPAEMATVSASQLHTLNNLFSRYRHSALRLSLIGLGVAALGIVRIYGPRKALRILVLPAGACLFTFGVFGLTGQTLNIFHLLGAFLGACLSFDYAVFVALTVPQAMQVRLNLVGGFVFDALPGWSDLFQQPLEERKRLLADPDYRRRLDEGANSEGAGLLRGIAKWENMRIAETFADSNQAYRGLTVGDVAQATGKQPFDAMLDVALADDLRTSFMPPSSGDAPEDWQARGRAWLDDRTVVGASDAGAHLDMIDTFALSTQVLGNGVRRHGVVSLEEGVRQLTDVPARLYGLRDRGRVQTGMHADLVVFDPDAIDCGPTYTRFDLPAGAGRLYADASGIDHVLVGGVEIVQKGEHTGALPGTVLRSGRDTETVEVPGGRR
jgi:hypothetical protein